MQQIKFRQPIYVDGKFDHWHYWGFVEMQSIVTPINFISPEYHWITCVGGSPGPPIAEAQASSQQLTPGKDRKGIECYVGDIVIAEIYADEPQTLEVIYRNGAFVIDFEDSESETALICDFAGSYKIIGNVTEHPELIQGGGR